MLRLSDYIEQPLLDPLCGAIIPIEVAHIVREYPTILLGRITTSLNY